MQDISQLKKYCKRAQADAIVNITGNIISSQVMGDTSKIGALSAGQSIVSYIRQQQ